MATAMGVAPGAMAADPHSITVYCGGAWGFPFPAALYHSKRRRRGMQQQPPPPLPRGPIYFRFYFLLAIRKKIVLPEHAA